MPNIEADIEKDSYSLFERFLYLILIPVIFTAVLFVVLFSVFDYDVMQSVLNTANKIPVIEKLVPDPPDKDGAVLGTTAKDETDSDKIDSTSSDPAEENMEQLVDVLEQQDEELVRLAQLNDEKDEYIAQLVAELERLENDSESLIDDEEYEQIIRQLAGTYAKMMPSRAANIMQNLTPSERTLLLANMRQNEQIKILEKMNPQIAAETTMLLKDNIPVKDLQIQALQERLKLYTDRENPTSEALDDEQLALTFANMNVKQAARVLMQMRSANESRVISILRAMDVASRSSILNEIANESESVAAQITVRLGE